MRTHKAGCGLQHHRLLGTVFSRLAMSDNEEWAALLKNHPIFDLPKAYDVPTKFHNSLELSTNTLQNFTREAPDEGTLTPSGRRQVMLLKDADLIVAVGKEIRISSFGDLKLSRSIRRTYKVCCSTLSMRPCFNKAHRPSTHPISNLKFIKLH